MYSPAPSSAVSPTSTLPATTSTAIWSSGDSRTANSVKVNGDFNPGFGGPLKREKVWFYAAARYMRADNYVAGVFFDTTQDDPNVWGYTPDLNRKAVNSGIWKDAQARLTWQATPLHKLAFW